jgi:ring-1,2-phenylacetyl-CoA epoxidase subunit PaaB
MVITLTLTNDLRETQPQRADIHHPAEGSGADWPVFEVFTQTREGHAFTHGGQVLAPDLEMALIYAREFYGRRQESHRLWVVPREAILELKDQDLLHPPAVDRSYRNSSGYSLRDRLRATRGEVLGSVQPD